MSFMRGKVKVAVLALVALAALAGIGGAAASHVFIFSLFFNYPPTGGSLSPYLVGYYDGREDSDSLAQDGCDERDDQCVDDIADDVDDVEPVLYLVNPTRIDLTAYVAVFDNEETFLGCDRLNLSPNDVTDFLTSKYNDDDDDVNGNSEDGFGAVKVVTFAASAPGIKVQAGVKGWLTHYVEQDNSDNWGYMRESELQEVPLDVLKKQIPGKGQSELQLIVHACETFFLIDGGGTVGTLDDADVED